MLTRCNECSQYGADLEEVTEQHNVNLHPYADDWQPYVAYTVGVTTWQPLLHALDIASMTSASGWQQIVCRWILRRPSMSALFWAGSKHNIVMLRSHAPALQLGSDTVTTSDHVRVLGVTISSELSLEKHISKTCTACFYWLRRLRRIRKSLGDESASTLVNVFVTSHVDYCNAVYAESPKTITNKLQLVKSSQVAFNKNKWQSHEF